jgi:hypothetical protein
MSASTSFGEYPWAACERRLMAHMLPVTTGQVSHPIALFILMKPNNRLFHDDLIPLRLTAGQSPVTLAGESKPGDIATILPGLRIRF